MKEVKIERYPDYKDSGVEWLGEIPEHWEVTKVKNVFRLVMEPSPKNNDFELLSVYTEIGVKPRKDLEERGNKASSTDGYWFVKKGDIVVNKLLAWMGAIGVSNYDGVTSPAYDILRSKVQLESNFYHYLFRNEACVSELKKHSRGIMDMRLRLYFDKFGDVMIPFPAYTEQKKIVSFLDNKTSQIESAIGIKQKQIELLNERRQILIHRAVTLGLNPNVKLKDSGVEWIGEIPQHWEIKAIKHLKANIKNAFVDGPFGSNLKSEHYIENGEVYVVESGFITTGIFINKKFKTISEKHYQTIKRSTCIEKDIIIAKIGANYGMAAELPLLEKKSVVSGNSLKISLDNSKILNTLFVKLFGLSKQLGGFESIVNASAQPALSLGGLNNLKLPIGPINEQEAIDIYVENIELKISTAISLKEKEIEKLKEYKSALINEAVTGKIKIT